MRTKKPTSLATQVHNISRHSDVNTIEEVTVTFLPLGICITNTAKVDLSDAMTNQRIDGFFYLTLINIPKTGKVVHQTVRNNAESDTVADFFLFHHETIDSIVEGRVATYYDNGFITIRYHHPHQALHTVCRLALNKVISHLALIKHLLNLLPTLALVGDTCLGTVKNAPLRSLYCHNCFIFSIFSSIGSIASIQCILKPLRSIPRNQVIWRLENWWMAISRRLVISP